MNRTELQQLAEERARDAEALLNAGRWSGPYYLAGYAVECGLKTCIASLTNQHDFPDKDLAQRCFTHKIEALVEVAGLVLQRNSDALANRTLAANWLIVKDWDEKARYRQWTEPQAREIFAAVIATTNGVLPWIRLSRIAGRLSDTDPLPVSRHTLESAFPRSAGECLSETALRPLRRHTARQCGASPTASPPRSVGTRLRYRLQRWRGDPYR